MNPAGKRELLMRLGLAGFFLVTFFENYGQIICLHLLEEYEHCWQPGIIPGAGFQLG